MIQNDASLRGKAKALAKKHGLSAQEVMQRYFFEHFLLRLERTDYRDIFIIKGGLLLSSLMGVAQRTTMDMDATVKGMKLDKESLKKAIEEICKLNIDDGIDYKMEAIEPIRKDDDYGGLRAQLTARYGRMNNKLKIDVTTGDAITPSEVEYKFPMLFDDGAISLMTYPIETILAEKYEAIVKRGAATTRARDFYDVVMIIESYGEHMDWDSFKTAVARTSERRRSSELLKDYLQACADIEDSPEIARIWSSYVRNNPYAENASLEKALETIRLLGKILEE